MEILNNSVLIFTCTWFYKSIFFPPHKLQQILINFTCIEIIYIILALMGMCGCRNLYYPYSSIILYGFMGRFQQGVLAGKKVGKCACAWLFLGGRTCGVVVPDNKE